MNVIPIGTRFANRVATYERVLADAIPEGKERAQAIVDVHAFLEVTSLPEEDAAEARDLGGNDGEGLGRAAVAPVGGSRLGIEVDEGDGLTRCGSCHGEILGSRGLPTTAFLADKRHNFHIRHPAKEFEGNLIGL
jgi:hypothetical protein